MQVDIITATKRPVDVIGQAAGTSYGKDDPSAKRVWTCYKRGHMSVFEHASFTARVDGISRACSHQLVRHRLASFVQQSQRYTEVDADGQWYVTPPVFAERPDYTCWYNSQMNQALASYEGALAVGVDPEDARYLLPQSVCTTLTVTMNVREFFHFLDLRADSAAQWEIRDLATELLRKVRGISGQWYELMGLWTNNGGDHE